MSFDDYVRADGTGSKDDATGPPDDPSKAMSLTTFNASNFAPGDCIGFSDQGGDGFSLDGNAEAVFYNISTQTTGQVAGSRPPESDINSDIVLRNVSLEDLSEDVFLL